MLEAEPKIAQELTEIIQKTSSQEIIDSIKAMQVKKKYKVKGKNKTAMIIKKSDFLEICKNHRDDGLSEDVIQAIEPVVCLNPN